MQNILLLNSSYVPIDTTSLKRAMKLLLKQKAEVISVENGKYGNYNFSSWEEVSLFRKATWDLHKNYDYFDLSGNTVGIPKVIRLTDFHQVPIKIRLNRKNIIIRDDHTCQYCGRKFTFANLNVDHVVPKAHKGPNTWTNMVCSCVPCNTRKRDRTPKQAGMKLLHQPVRPSIYMIFKKYKEIFMDDKFEEWKSFFPEDFITSLYLEVELK